MNKHVETLARTEKVAVVETRSMAAERKRLEEEEERELCADLPNPKGLSCEEEGLDEESGEFLAGGSKPSVSEEGEGESVMELDEEDDEGDEVDSDEEEVACTKRVDME